MADSAAEQKPTAPAVTSRPWREALLWCAAMSAYFILAYGGCNWITSQRSDVGTFYFEWERHIPFVPIFIIPYMSIDLFFVGSFFLCRDRPELRTLGKRIFAAITIACTCFLLFPLRFGFERPEVSGWQGAVFHFLWGFDQPYNMAPSLHIALRSILWFVYVRHLRGGWRWIVQGWFVLIGVSTLLTWQHHVIDVVSGQLLALLCFYLFPDPEILAQAWPRARDLLRRNLRAGRRYAAGAVVFAIAALALRPWGLLLLWPAFLLTMLAAAYLALGPVVFRKINGRLPWSTRLWLGPYLLGSRVSFEYYRPKSPPYVQVAPAPGIYLGRILRHQEAEALVGQGVTAVLDLTAEYPECRRMLALSYHNVPVLDLTAPTQEQIAASVAFMRRHVEAGGQVYVHCALGYSRSACTVAAYLLASGKAATVEEAIEQVRTARPQVVLTPELRQALERYRQGLPARPTSPRCSRDAAPLPDPASNH